MSTEIQNENVVAKRLKNGGFFFFLAEKVKNEVDKPKKKDVACFVNDTLFCFFTFQINKLQYRSSNQTTCHGIFFFFGYNCFW